ncbi:MAG: RluA family pseudouridine synthase [Bacilli bacterium]
MKLNILFEDNHIIVVFKPSGILSQEDYTKDIDMVNIVKNYIKEKYFKPGNVYLGLVHRLDRNVSGIMVFAKTSKAANRLSNQIKNKKFNKGYHGVLCGKLIKNGTISNYLIKDEKNKKAYVTNKNKGKLASLSYKIIANKNSYTLVEIDLETGRFHQIRCQFANLGYPLFGDYKYGNSGSKNYKLGLCATSLSFTHPTLKEKMEFAINLPKERHWNLFNEGE